MNTCDKHRKDHVGSCMWCGKKVCEFCIAKIEGKKLYCAKCQPVLGGIRRDPIPRIGPRLLPAQGRKYVLQDGYLVMDGH